MTTTTVKRIHNFSAGPATLPLEVLEIAQREFLNYNNSGMSIVEMSHRSKEFTKVIEHTEAQFRKLLGISDKYAVLFLQGGASLQFSMVPMNLCQEGRSVDVVSTGVWSKKAIKEIEPNHVQ
jgi:phosphoserine aminotransferase